MEYIELISVGVLAGIISAFFGIGGGLVIVPLLILIYPDMPYGLVLGCSFGTIFLNSILNTINFKKLNLLPPFSFLRSFIVGAIPGVLIGTYLVTTLPSEISKQIFAIFLILVVINNVIRCVLKQETKPPQMEGREGVKLVTGVGAGLVAGLTGVGGGTVLVPVFLSVFRLPPKKISPASNAVMIFLTGLAFMKMALVTTTEYAKFSNFQLGKTNILIILVIFLGSLLSSKFGAKLNKICSDQLKTIIFSVMLIGLALKIFLD